jgi:anion transporter
MVAIPDSIDRPVCVNADSAARALRLRHLMAVIGIVAGVIVALLPVPTGLTRAAMLNFGGIVWAIISWATRTLPGFATAIILAVFWLVVLRLPASIALGSFSETTEWLILSALVMAVALEKTGLALRVARWSLNRLPHTYTGQVLSLVLCGILFGPVVPDAIAKISMFGPIAVGIGEESGYAPRSKAMAGLTLGCWLGVMPLGSALFMTGSPPNLAVFAALGAAGKDISWARWFVAAAPLIALEGMVLVPYLLATSQPGTQERLQCPTTPQPLAPVGRSELVTALVLIVCVLLWATSSLHHIEAAWIALAGVAVLAVLGVIDRSDFGTKVDWELWIYLGLIMSIGPVMTALGASKWLGEMLSPAFIRLNSSPAVFLVATVCMVFILRLLLANSITPGVLTVVILSPVASVAGIHPFLLVLVSVAASKLWLLPYMNPVFLALCSSTHGNGFSQAQANRLNLVFMGCIVIGVAVCVPWWRFIGLIQTISLP